MATATFTWAAWDTTNAWQNLADAGNNANLAYARDATDVAAKFTTTTKSATMTEYGRKSGAGDSWSSIFGLASNAFVKQIALTSSTKKLVALTKLSSHTLTLKFITDGAVSVTDNPLVNAASLSITPVDGSYVTGPSGSAVNVLAQYQDAATSVRFSLEYTVVMGASGSSASLDQRFDSFLVTITYGLATAASSAGTSTTQANSGAIAASDASADGTSATSVDAEIVVQVVTIETDANAAGSCAPLLKDLVSYWKLDESSGARVDSHGGNDLTDHSVGSAGGKIGNAAAITTNQYLSHDSNASLQIGATSFTIACWIKPTTLPATAPLVSKDNQSSTREFDLMCTSSGVQFWVFYNDLADTGVDKIAAGYWYLIVAWYDKSLGKAFVQINNSTIYQGAGGGGDPATGTAEFDIGSRHDHDAFFNGLIDEVALWKRTLTADERAAIYNTGNGLPYPSFGITFDAARVIAAEGSCAATSATSVDSSRVLATATTVSCAASTSVVTSAIWRTGETLACTSSTNVASNAICLSAETLACTSATSLAAAAVWRSGVTLACTSATTINSGARISVDANTSGTSTASADYENASSPIREVEATSAGTSTAQANVLARARIAVEGSLTGSGTAAANTSATNVSAASSTGLSVVAGSLAAIWRISGSAAGSVTISLNSSAIKTSAASALGTSSTNVQASDAATGSDGAAAGTSTATANSQVIAGVRAATSCASTVAAQANALASVAGSSICVAIVNGLSLTIIRFSFSEAGTSVASAVAEIRHYANLDVQLASLQVAFACSVDITANLDVVLEPLYVKIHVMPSVSVRSIVGGTFAATRARGALRATSAGGTLQVVPRETTVEAVK